MKKSFLCQIMLTLLMVGGLCGCIKNDIPFPRITQNILKLVAEGESKSSYIDSIAFEVDVYLDETTDIENVRFTEYEISEGGTSDPDLLDGTYDLSKPLYVTLTRFQEYTWEVIGHQDIERYFEVAGQIGESVIDPVGHRVIVNFPEGTNLKDLTLLKVKLGPKDITVMTPDLRPGKIDLSYPLRVAVMAHGRTEIWVIYAELLETAVKTTQVDAWAEVIWAYGEGSASGDNGFEYREGETGEWVAVPDRYVTRNQGIFSCYIPHLKPLTQYFVRAVSGDNHGEEFEVKTEGTADIPDGSFEEWYQTSNGMWCPWNEFGQRFWDTGNTGSMTLKVNLTTPTDYTPTGSGKAARCESRKVAILGVGKLGTGSIFSGTYVKTDGTNGILAFGREWKLRPTKLKGYFQYDGKTIDEKASVGSEDYVHLIGRPDSCHIYVALTDWTAPYEIRTKPTNRQLFDKNASYVIAYGELTYSGHMEAYEEFEIKLTYRNTSTVPSYLLITSAASKYGDYFVGGNGSLLYVDEYSFGWDLE